MPIEIVQRRVGHLLVCSLTIERPPLNVIDYDHAEEFAAALRQVGRQGPTVVIVRGGGRCFSAGVDVRQHSPEEIARLLPAFHGVIRELTALHALTVAAIHGHCLGGAAEVALACDRIIADSTTRMGFPEIDVGCYPPVALAALALRVGRGRATELITGGEALEGRDLLDSGLVDRLVPAGSLDEAIDAELSRWSGKSPSVLRVIAQGLHDEVNRTWVSRLDEIEATYFHRLLPLKDMREGVSAFCDKRPPVWEDLEGPLP